MDFHSEVTVLVGVNGSGKTSVLDAIALLLGWDTESLPRPSKTQLQRDIRLGCRDLELVASLEVLSRPVKLAYYLRENSNESAVSNGAVVRTLGQKVTRPILCYYSINRQAKDATPSVAKPGNWNKENAWDFALNITGVNYDYFFHWFREREDIENEQLRDEPTYRDHQIESVRRAIEYLLPGYTNPRVRRPRFQKNSPGPGLDQPVLVIQKNGEELAFDQLSEGERTLTTLVGDIARRLAIANPDSEDPLQGEGMVMIDEIDLHLHPEWQARIIPALRRTFPNVQIIGTTHSPFVLSRVDPECVRLFTKDFEVFKAPAPTKGRDPNSLYVEVFGVSLRDDETQRRIDRIAELIDLEALDEARLELEALAQQMGSHDPEITKFRSFIDLLEV